MDTNSLGLIAIMVVLVSACIVMYLGFFKAMRRAGSEGRRRLIARSAFVTWLALAVFTPAMMLSALDVLPRWVCGVGMIAASVIGVLAARYARRSTMRSQNFG